LQFSVSQQNNVLERVQKTFIETLSHFGRRIMIVFLPKKLE